MFRTDECVTLVNDKTMGKVAFGQETLKTLLEAATLSYDMPRERVLNAVKDEVDFLLKSAQCAVARLFNDDKSSVILAQAKELLHTNTCYFPRAEIVEFLAQNEQALLSHESGVKLKDALTQAVNKHKAFEKRLSWLLKPNTAADVDGLDPVADCEQIFHFVTYDFRAEMKIFAVLYELRAIISANSALFFRSTDEFDQRSVRRIIDTVYLFANVLEWGIESRRGQFCMNRINEIHGRYYIPNEGMKYVLAGIMFIPHEWNARFGWRKFTEVEKLGWFHAFRGMGIRMNIQGLSDNFDEMYQWYLDYSAKNAFFTPVKRDLFDAIIKQVLAEYPAKVRPALLTTILAGMDDVYRIASGYPEPPKDVFDAVRAVFFTIGHAGNALPRAPWIRSLQSNPIYPYGYRIEELGVPKRNDVYPTLCPFSAGMTITPKEPGLAVDGNRGYPEGMRPILSEESAPKAALPFYTWEEIKKHNIEGDLWIAIDGYVYDVSLFAKDHPGGVRVMLSQAGKDASKAFAKVGHSPEANIFKLNFRIGQVAEELPAHEADIPLELGA
jgi:predicted heme/steroid binding protein